MDATEKHISSGMKRTPIEILRARLESGLITQEEHHEMQRAILIRKRMKNPGREALRKGFDIRLASGEMNIKTYSSICKISPLKNTTAAKTKSETPKEILDKRLALGEITLEQYNKILDVIKPAEGVKGEHPKEKEASHILEESSTGLVTSIFGKEEKIQPTDRTPYKVTKDTYLHGTFLTHDGKKISYDLIRGLDYDSSSFTVNSVATQISVSLKIIVKGHSSIYLTGSSAVFKGYKVKAIGNAYRFLIPKSFKSRWNKYIDQFKSRGYILQGGVQIYQNGDVKKKEKTINLKESYQAGNLVIGTRFSFLGDSTTNPDEVVVGENGTSAFSNRIVFNLTRDKDVMRQLLNQIAAG